MPTSKEIADRLQQQEADYLRRLEQAGQLPTTISEAWKKAGGEEEKALRGQEAGALTNYVGAAPAARSKYQDIWNPFERESLVGEEMKAAYSPIANVRAELAMRAEALGLATQSATSMYTAGSERARTGVEFTRSAYERAIEEEKLAEQKRQYEQDRADALAAAARAKSSGGGGGGGGSKGRGTKKTSAAGGGTPPAFSNAVNYASGLFIAATPYKKTNITETQILPKMKEAFKGQLSESDIIKLVYDVRMKKWGT